MNERTIFMEALEQESSEGRSEYLDFACAGDSALRQRVEALLESHEHAEGFLDQKAPEFLSADFAAGQTADVMQDGDPCDEYGDEELSFLTPTDKPGSLGRLGHYDIQEVVGRGGMGIVLKAFDEKLHRVVAIKVMAAQLATSATARKRFTREAQAAAAVSHDHVVTIHAVEESNGRPYIAMQYVAGMSLDERIDRGGPMEVQEILRVGMQAAAGLDAAHAQGLIHRDIKPANILLENGVERVKITDFGLARAAADASLTQSGTVAGTPHYMAPEQARGDVLDARTDLFSLGSVLYAMCTGRSPFRASGNMAVLKRVCEETPISIREINPQIPDWLVAIVDKLHAKDPKERFQSAAEVAELLSRHLAHVQHPSIFGQISNLSVRRKPHLKTAPRRYRWTIAAAVLLLCLLGGLSLTEATGVTNVRATVIRIATGEGTLVVEVDDPEVTVTIEGDGGLVITGAGTQEVRLRPGSYHVHALKDGKPVAVDRELITISRGGKQMVTIRLEAVAPTTAAKSGVGEVRRHRWFNRHTYSTAFSPDSRYYAATGAVQAENTARVWDIESGKLIMEVVGNEVVLFTPDTKQLITAGPDKELHVWEVPTGKEVRKFGKHPDWISLLMLAPNGRQLLSSCNDGNMRLWDLASGEELARFDHDGQLCFGFFSPDSKQIVSVSARGDGLVRLWDAAEGKQLRQWKHDSKTWWAQFAPDGQHFMTFAKDTVYFWDSASDEEPRSLRLEAGAMRAIGVSPDGQRLLYGMRDDPTVRLVELPGGKPLASFEVPDPAYGHTKISPDGRFGVAAGGSGWVYLWRLPVRPKLKESSAKVEQGAFVLLGGAGVDERKFDTLAEAVQRASDGDTIEVRGNGPFVSDGVNIRQRLVIRAGEGYTPSITLSQASAEKNIPLLTTSASLALEGLELRRVGGPEGQIENLYPSLLRAWDGSGELEVVNCRLVSNSSVDTDGVLILSRFPVCALRNCQFSGGANRTIDWYCPAGGHATIENCVTAAAGLLNLNSSSAVVRIRNNTAVGGCLGLGLMKGAEPATDPPLRLDFSANVINCPPSYGRGAMLRVNYAGLDPFLPKRGAEVLLLDAVALHEQKNVYASGARMLRLATGDGHGETSPEAIRGKDLADWNRLWSQTDTGSLEGRIRLQGGDVFQRALTAPQQLTTEDFRLRPDSAGYRAGPDGKDLGADVDLVGPGPAYERWKQTPGYQQWLEETGQTK